MLILIYLLQFEFIDLVSSDYDNNMIVDASMSDSVRIYNAVAFTLGKFSFFTGIFLFMIFLMTKNASLYS